jgi:hypothetical protein
VLAARAKEAPNSFIAEPHPAELITTVSTPARSNSAIVCSANLAASAARPECSDSAPQQPWPGGTITSQPSAASTRAVAALTPEKKTCWTQPVSMPTTARRWPRAGIRAGSLARRDADRGASRSDPASSGAYRAAGPRWTSRSSLARWAARSGPLSARSRFG